MDGMPRTLLLNASYEALTVVDWKRAIGLVVLERVDLVEEYEATVSSPRETWRIPAVIRLKNYLRRPWVPVPFSRKNIFLRDEFRCQYCLVGVTTSDATIDHVHPRSRGGLHRWENVTTACGPCNRKKGARTPSEAGMPLQQQPYRPRWLPFTKRPGGFSFPQEWEPWLHAA